LSSQTPIPPPVLDPTPLTVAVRHVGRRTLIEVEGEIDMATAGVLADTIHTATEAGAVELWIDLGGVGFMDSSGLHTLIAARARLTTLNRRMTVICPPGNARRVIDVAGVEALLGVVPSRAAAHRAS
jgi:anti-sigma B factor antagonist